MSRLNWKLAAVAAIAVLAVFLVLPSSTAVLPLIAFAACPLMMIFMMRGHGGHHEAGGTPPRASSYVCPMHSDVRSTFPARCPRCGMELEPSESDVSARIEG